MAKALGISLCGFQKKEQGKTPLLARELEAISRLSGIPMEQIKIPL